jgi:hypothetical protein
MMTTTNNNNNQKEEWLKQPVSVLEMGFSSKILERAKIKKHNVIGASVVNFDEKQKTVDIKIHYSDNRDYQLFRNIPLIQITDHPERWSFTRPRDIKKEITDELGEG